MRHGGDYRSSRGHLIIGIQRACAGRGGEGGEKDDTKQTPKGNDEKDDAQQSA
jgi:hypothetical protein